MKSIILFTAIILQSTILFSKGASGTYFITGQAFSSNSDLILNQDLQVKIGDKKFTVTTDSSGYFEIEVFWSTECPSGISKKERVRLTRKMNPKYIKITFEKSQIKLRNKWRKYGKLFSTREERTWTKDINFKSKNK